MSGEQPFYLRYYVGHRGKFGHEFIEFDVSSNGLVRERRAGRARPGAGSSAKVPCALGGRMGAEESHGCRSDPHVMIPFPHRRSACLPAGDEGRFSAVPVAGPKLVALSRAALASRALCPHPAPLQLRYANNSNYKNDTMIRKQVHVSPAVLGEFKRVIESSEVRVFRRTRSRVIRGSFGPYDLQRHLCHACYPRS